MKIKVIKTGMLTTVQDLGRLGYAHLGISPAGAADSYSFRSANLLVGNAENTPALEMTQLGATLEFDGNEIISVTGASGAENDIPMWQAVEVPAGYVFRCGALRDGARAYLAVQGGFSIAKQMHSAATYLAAGIGGFHGRALKNGDILEAGELPHNDARRLRPECRALLLHGSISGEIPIRVTKGVQWDWFSPDTITRFLSSGYSVTEQSNRAGLRLAGNPIFPKSEAELLTEGVALGAIQIPPNGQPIILFVDQQTTGGYPKIANVISADLHRIGQLRPRDPLRFELVSIEQAVSLLCDQEEFLREAFLP